MDKENNGHCDHCKKCHGLFGDMAGNGHWSSILIKILVALFIFWAGVQFGELKSVARGGYLAAPSNGTYYGGMMGGWR